MKLILENACSKYGASMGRRNRLPGDVTARIRLHLARLPLVDGDYDRGGAYWGGGPTPSGGMWAAWGEDSSVQVRVFVRGVDRNDARHNVLEVIPGAVFYR